MRSIILDSCTLINLINAEALTIVFSLSGFKFFIGELVYDECCQIDEQKTFIDICINTGKVEILKDQISITEFKEIKSKYSLGDGESESIALSKKIGYAVATDDSKARKSVVKEVGETQLCGSIFLIRELIQQCHITCLEGQEIQNIMIACGGFLPRVDEDYLCK